MKKFLLLLFISHFTFAQKTAFELDSNTTCTYPELIAFYQTLANNYSSCKLYTEGPTDSGKNLHLLVISEDGTFTPQAAHQKGKTVILVNNGIHPGEPEGMDAAAMLARDILKKKSLPIDIVLCIIPVYNIGGMLNRGVSRVNQNGPKEYGFRGNALNYDLNRDFLKTDSKNSHSFQSIFQKWKPDLFMDTHTSNGADYQHIMTLIDTQNDKLQPALQSFGKAYTESLYKRMKESGYDMVPYVNGFKGAPEDGIVSFLETPRYSTGYAALHHVVGYMPETHMWKPYPQRVRSTYALLQHFINPSPEQIKQAKAARKAAIEEVKQQKFFPLTWKVDTTRYEKIEFLGFVSGQKKSEVTGLNRLYYDREKPFTKTIPYYNSFVADITVEKPKAYLIPQGYTKAIELLNLNGVKMKPLDKDQKLLVEVYYIDQFRTSPTPYEGHYIHSDVKLKVTTQEIAFSKGDWIIETGQEADRYLVEALEPQSSDSFFNWNFFDAVLGQKEHYSAYIFEEEAYKLLQDNPDWKKEFEELRAKDEKFRNSSRAQLDWIYKKSPYYERTHMRYPVFRLR
ncbi:peptidase M14 carboxypeptidase A [Leadbetterella byssophila DSM 17132]|uniref:Peptidase M14 carboxypeptidase A n=1 Tax=Leadbetterella byssophila (strain DSM 17132 / JCM 16389 / KACC 11308 / NBRC 106382 / 4M15) TaxID=649349 RepID=E4RXP9_LEAB4|nr:M14 family zinc carboxypeptidase [Leadbetterella byssophila]ADQ18113.1 peptidase M14 carboxypeptidase A [Leadbetterella byssophila DSM 17132]